jgi:hypothetical protein
MATINYVQTSLVTGEIAPDLQGRSELTKYKSALHTCHNFLVSAYGSVTRRSGTQYIYNAKSNTDTSRLVRFEYSVSQSYMLEFNNNTIRFFRDQGIILQGRDLTNQNFTSNITGWTARNSGTGAISHDAGNGRLSLTGGGGGNEARAYQSIANLGVSQYTCTVDVLGATVTYNIGTSSGGTQIATGSLTVGSAKTFTFTPSTNGTVYIEFQASGSAQIDNVSLNSPIYTIDTIYTQAELNELSFARSYDTMYITHKDHKPQQLQRLGHDNWVISEVTFIEPPYLDENITSTKITPSATTGSITVTASTSIFASTDVGRAIRYKAGPDKSDVTTYTGTGAQTYFDIPFYPQGSSDLIVNFLESTGARTSKTYTAGVPGAGQFTITNGQVRTGDTATTSQRVEVSPVNVGSGEWGWMTITGYTSGTQVSATVERDLAGTNASDQWRLGAWSTTTGYPKTAIIHEQRLLFANTATQPYTFWGSEIGNYTNFQPDNVLYKGAVDNDTSYSFTLSGEASQAILWMRSKGALLIGTSSSIHSAKGSNGGITVSNITVRKESDVRCADIDPAETKDEVIFIDKRGRRVYSVFYQFEIDGYAVQEISLLSDHLGGEYPIQQLDYQDSAKTIWARRSNGTILSCIYVRSQEVNGWSRYTLGGTNANIEGICIIPGSSEDELWLGVGRTINSSSKKYIELLRPKFEFTTKENARYLDCSVTYEGASATVITGLDHLTGETISVLANGSVHRDVTVSGGSITLEYAVTNAVFGFNFTSELITLSPDVGSQIGSALSSITRVTEVALKFKDTLGGEYGYDSSNTDIIPFREASDNMNSSPELFSGFKVLKFNSGFNRDFKVYLKQEQPLPMTVLNIVFKAQVSDAQ